MAGLNWVFAALGTAAVVTSVACGGKVEEDGPSASSTEPALFTNTPAAKRDASLLGRALAVPEKVAYLGHFRPLPLAPSSYGVPGETRGFRVAAFDAQEYPWTNGDYRACVRDGACVAGAVSEVKSGPRDEDSAYALVTYDVAQSACRAHGGEVISAAQLASLMQVGERRLAWAAFETDVLSRCDRPSTCDPFNVPQDDRRFDVEAARGPYGHRGLLGGAGDLVRGFPLSYSWSLSGASVTASRPDIGEESGAERPSRFTGPLDQLINYHTGPIWDTTPGPADANVRGRFRCAFPRNPNR